MNLATMIPADKLGHMKTGAAVAAFGGGLWLVAAFVLMQIGAKAAVPMAGAPFACFLAPLVAGITKEKADAMDNALMAAEGRPAMHGVELLDVAATAAPGVPIGMLLYAALHYLL